MDHYRGGGRRGRKKSYLVHGDSLSDWRELTAQRLAARTRCSSAARRSIEIDGAKERDKKVTKTIKLKVVGKGGKHDQTRVS